MRLAVKFGSFYYDFTFSCVLSEGIIWELKLKNLVSKQFTSKRSFYCDFWMSFNYCYFIFKTNRAVALDEKRFLVEIAHFAVSADVNFWRKLTQLGFMECRVGVDGNCHILAALTMNANLIIIIPVRHFTIRSERHSQGFTNSCG